MLFFQIICCIVVIFFYFTLVDVTCKIKWNLLQRALFQQLGLKGHARITDTFFFPPLMFYMNWETLPIIHLIPQRSVFKATNSTFSDSGSTSEDHVQFFMCIQPCSRTGGGSPCCSPKGRQQRDVRKQKICLATVLTPIIISKSSQQSNRFPNFLVIKTQFTVKRTSVELRVVESIQCSAGYCYMATKHHVWKIRCCKCTICVSQLKSKSNPRQ